jgi:predicted nucleic acid-binding protein
MIYLDSSYLTKLYLREHGSVEVERWLAAQSRQVVCCLHGRLEIFGALKRQQREKRITEANLRAIARRLESEERAGLVCWLPIDTLLIGSACDRVRKLAALIFLRSADALHLTCAADAGLHEIYSHDRHLLSAAPHFGLKGIDIIPPP